MKDDKLHMRISVEMKREFLRVCDDRAIAPAKLIRKWIKEFIFQEGADSGHENNS